MDEKETNIILKYKRDCDSWLCSGCDTENAMSLSRCTVCGCRKSSSAEVLKQWTEQTERTVTPPNKKTSPTSEPISKGTDKDAPEGGNKNKIIWGIIIAIIIIGLIVAASQGSTYAAYSDTMNEFNNDIAVKTNNEFSEIDFNKAVGYNYIDEMIYTIFENRGGI